MLPLFKSHFSTGKSILTLFHPDKCVDGGADSVFKLAVDNNLKQIKIKYETAMTEIPQEYNGGYHALQKEADKDTHTILLNHINNHSHKSFISYLHTGH